MRRVMRSSFKRASCIWKRFVGNTILQLDGKTMQAVGDAAVTNSNSISISSSGSGGGGAVNNSHTLTSLDGKPLYQSRSAVARLVGLLHRMYKYMMTPPSALKAGPPVRPSVRQVDRKHRTGKCRTITIK